MPAIGGKERLENVIITLCFPRFLVSGSELRVPVWRVPALCGVAIVRRQILYGCRVVVVAVNEPG